MGKLTLRFKKKADADAALTCVRDDGSWTSSRLGPANGYRPVHDLAHFVAESAFGLTGGFLGLLARGWDVEDFEAGAVARIAREPDSEHAWLAEGLAGMLSLEAMSGQEPPVDETNGLLRELIGRASPTCEPPLLSAEELAGMRARLKALRRRWNALPAGETLELRFEPGQRSPLAENDAVRKG
jgi:hypothetical protein